MPNVSFVLTNAVRGAWGSYWKRRPNDEPLDLFETLVNSEVVKDPESFGLKPKPGTQLWSHQQMPGHLFLVKDVKGVEHLVITIVKERVKKTPLLEPKPKVVEVDVTPVQVVEISHELMPDIGVEPDGTPQERWAWCKSAVDTLSKWLSRNTKRNPKYATAVALNTELMRRQKGYRLEVQRIAEEEMANDERGELFEVNGRIVCLPAIRWLLNRVKELQARVDQLETTHEATTCTASQSSGSAITAGC